MKVDINADQIGQVINAETANINQQGNPGIEDRSTGRERPNTAEMRDSTEENPSKLQGLKVFLCHGSEDKAVVRELYAKLRSYGITPWLDEEDILPGQDWDGEIRRAVRASDAILVCLSSTSAGKSGYLQKEIRFALDVADEKPDGAIFIIPVRIEECDIPERLRRWQWVNYYDPQGFDKLIRALRKRGEG